MSNEYVAPKPTATITRNGMEVQCWGEWTDTSNCVICGDWSDGSEMEEIWAGDGMKDGAIAQNWTQVVEHLTSWASAKGHTIIELQSC